MKMRLRRYNPGMRLHFQNLRAELRPHKSAAFCARLLCALLLCAGWTIPAQGAESDEKSGVGGAGERTLFVVGVGRAEAEADRAVVRAALHVTAGSGLEAKRELEVLMSELLAEFAEAGIDSDAVRAQSLRLDAVYEGVLFSGYQARRDVSVMLDDLERIGDVTDMLARRKRARIHGLDYRGSGEDAARELALERAMADSLERAGRIAAGFGMELGRPVKIVHIRPAAFARPRAAGMLAMAAKAPPSAPYLAEALTFEETVEVVFEIR